LDAAGVTRGFFGGVGGFFVGGSEKELGLVGKSGGASLAPFFAGGLEQHTFETGAGNDRVIGDAFANDRKINRADGGSGANVERGASIEADEVFGGHEEFRI